MVEIYSFGYWILRRRKALDLTREELAKKVGCASETIKKIERDERRPSQQVAKLLAQALAIPAKEQELLLQVARGERSFEMLHLDSEPLTALPIQQYDLPIQLTSFIGREGSLAEIHDYLLRADIRLVTLIGPPGTGKTRLSIEAARQSLSDFPTGVCFVGLATLEDPKLIAATVRQALGYMEDPKLPAEQHLMQAIGEKQLLIVLDNCEHLVDDAASFASRLLSGCSRLKILATSREALHLAGEWLYTVPPLELPETTLQVDVDSALKNPALNLFAERARAVRRDFSLTTDNLQTVSAICRELDGLPLAIELMAAQIHLHSPQSLWQRMHNRSILYMQGTRAVPSRQLSLRHAINWSYDSLTPDEKRLFAYLSIFAGGFTLSAAESMFSAQFVEKPVSELVASLMDKSLLQQYSAPDGELRFHMLVSIHYFASDQLQRISDAWRVRDSHLAYFVELAERADSEVRGPNQVQCMDCLEKELDNFRSILDWCVAEQKVESALRLLNALKWTWAWRGYFSETENWFNKIRELPNVLDYPAPYASLLNHIGYQWLHRDVDIARSTLEESHKIWLALGSAGEHGLAEVFAILGDLALYAEKSVEKAQFYFEQSLELYQKHEDEQETAWLMYKLGTLAHVTGQYVEAEKRYMNSLAQFQKLGDMSRVAYVLSGLGELARFQGDYERAEIFWEQNLEIFCSLRVPPALAHPYHALACVSFRMGKYDKAQRLFDESLRIFKDNRDRSGVALCLGGLAGVLGMAGKPEQAARLLGAVELLLESTPSLEPADQRDLDHCIAIVRSQLEGSAFEQARGEGRALTIAGWENIIAYAMEKFE